MVVLATVCAFVVHLALRGKTVSIGYDLGRARSEQARLREVKRVLELEVASYKTPERVEIVARTLLGMETPSPDRVIQLNGPSTASASPAANAPVGGDGAAAKPASNGLSSASNPTVLSAQEPSSASANPGASPP